MTIESLFAAVRTLPPEDRAAYLLAHCPDPAQRQEVEALLAAHAASNLLDRPAVDLGATAGYFRQESENQVGTRIGPYKLLQLLGEGGMGEVWAAEQTEPVRRRVALKLIKPGMDSRQVLARFDAERQALALMDHPNIARVLDAGTTDDGRPYFAMELVKGTPITTFCDVRKLNPRERLNLFVQVCRAIQHAHTKGIIHRDIKPTNVLVELHDDLPVVKVIDFGVAKALGGTLTDRTLYTAVGALVGTPMYMAPEQATFNALDVDTRADVYALGVLLYELLTGSPPLEPKRLKQAALEEVLRVVREEEPPRPSQRLSTSETRAGIAASRSTEAAALTRLVRGELDWIVMRALEKDRSRRYESPSALAKDVERHLAGESVEACPPSTWYRLRKWFVRNRTAAHFGILLLAAATVSTIIAVWAIRAERREAEARGKAERSAELLREKARDLRRSLYLTDMKRIHLAWQDDDLPAIRAALDRHIPRPGEEELRGFEWGYWDALLNEPTRRCLTDRRVATPCFLSEGGRFALAGLVREEPDKVDVVVWDTATGQALFSVVAPMAGGQLSGRGFVGAVSSDGEFVAEGATESPLIHEAGAKPQTSLRIWERRTGRLLSQISREGFTFSGCRFSPDSRRISLGTLFGTLTWDCRTGQLVPAPNAPEWERGRLYASAYSGDGRKRLILHREGRQTRFLANVADLWGTGIQTDAVTPWKVALHAHGLSKFGREPQTTTAQLFDEETGKELLSFSLAGSIHRLELDHTGAHLVTVGTQPDGLPGGRATIWTLDEKEKTATPAGSFAPEVSAETYLNAKYRLAPDGSLLLAKEDRFRSVKLLSVPSLKSVRVFRAEAAITDLAFAADGSAAILIDEDATVSIWRPLTPPAKPFPPSGGTLGGIVSEDGELWAGQDEVGASIIADHAGRIRKCDSWASPITFSGDRKRLAVANKADELWKVSIQILDTESGRVVFTDRTTLPATIVHSGFAIDHQGDRFAYATPTELVVHGIDGRPVQRVTHQEALPDLKLSKDGQLQARPQFAPDGTLAVVYEWKPKGAWSWPVRLVVYDSSMQVRYRVNLGDESGLGDCRFSRDGKLLAVTAYGAGKAGGRVMVLNANDGSPVFSRRGPNWDGSLFSPDGQRLAVNDHHLEVIRLLDVATGEEVLTLPGANVRSLRFTPDGSELLGEQFLRKELTTIGKSSRPSLNK